MASDFSEDKPRKYFLNAVTTIRDADLRSWASTATPSLLAHERGAKLKVVPVDSSGQLRTDRTKIVSITHVSNALGTVTPARDIVDLAHRAGALALIDGAQSVSHMPIDVQALGADFFVLSGHKIFGPTGIGILYGRAAVLENMPPWQGGGNMIEDVTFESTRYQSPPARFERIRTVPGCLQRALAIVAHQRRRSSDEKATESAALP